MKHRTIFVAKIAAILSVIPALIYAFRSGPEPRVTGAPGEMTCWQIGCHQTATGTLIQDSQNINIDFGGTSTYTPGGAAQRWTITVNDPQGVVFGFQVSARVESDNGQAGAFASVDASVRVLCADGTNKGAAGCGTHGEIEYPEHTGAGGSPKPLNQSYSLDWTPPANDVGNVKVYLALNAANNDTFETGDRIHLRAFTLAPAAAGPKPSIDQGGAIHAWNFQPVISDTAWISIFGSNFAPPGTFRTWRDGDIVGGMLPTSLDGVKVSINNKDAFMHFLSDRQINVQVPSDGAAGQVEVRVTTPTGGMSDPIMVTKQAIAPGLFTWADFGDPNSAGAVAGALENDAVVFIAKPGVLPAGTQTRPARRNEVVLLFATGCGPMDPAVPAGQVISPPIPRLTSPVNIRIGGMPAGVADNTGFVVFAGGCQFNVTIPGNAPDGDLLVELDIGGVSTGQNITIPVQGP